MHESDSRLLIINGTYLPEEPVHFYDFATGFHC